METTGNDGEDIHLIGRMDTFGNGSDAPDHLLFESGDEAVTRSG